MEANDSLLAMKRGLLRELGRRIATAGSSQEAIARRLGVPRPEISAILAGNTQRFTVERILRMLKRCGSEINVEVVPRGRGGQVRAASLRDLGLAWLPPHIRAEPGLTLIGGDPNEGQRELLLAILGEHTDRGDRAVLYGREAQTELPHVPFRTDSDLAKWVTYHDDIDLPQRERFGAPVVGIDSVAASAASPWTVLHFAKNQRVYALIPCSTSTNEGQRTIDEFVRLLGKPHMGGSWRQVHDVVDTIIVPRVCAVARDDGPTYVASLCHAEPDDPIVRTIVDAAKQEEELVSKGLIHPRPAVVHAGPLLTEEQARAFLCEVRERLGDEFQVTGPGTDSKKELEVSVCHRDCSATVDIAASWSASNRRYSIVMTTEEPEELADERVPETSLSLAPTDVYYVVSRTNAFLAAFGQESREAHRRH